MVHSHDPNPFAAPQANISEPIGDVESHPEAAILEAVEFELSKTKLGIKALGFAAFAIAGFTLWQMLSIVAQIGFIAPMLVHLLTIAFYVVAGVLALRIAGKIKEFSLNPKTYTMEEVFSAHAFYWKYVGIVAVLFLAIGIPLLVLSILMF